MLKCMRRKKSRENTDKKENFRESKRERERAMSEGEDIRRE